MVGPDRALHSDVKTLFDQGGANKKCTRHTHTHIHTHTHTLHALHYLAINSIGIDIDVQSADEKSLQVVGLPDGGNGKHEHIKNCKSKLWNEKLGKWCCSSRLYIDKQPKVSRAVVFVHIVYTMTNRELSKQAMQC